MKRPIARPTGSTSEIDTNLVPTPSVALTEYRMPRAYASTEAEVSEEEIDSVTEQALLAPPSKPMGWLGKLAWTTGGILVSLGLTLMADRLIRDLYARYEWLGWAGIIILAVFVLALVALVARELFALRRLGVLDQLRLDAAEALKNDKLPQASLVFRTLDSLYSARPDLARARQAMADNEAQIFDGPALIHFAERTMMAPLDARARALTAASARRVALVTAVSPRALIDVTFVIYESVRLAGAIAALYGARPGLLGFWRLTGSVLAHLAVTGGLVLTDGIVEQLVGQGLAAKLSARLGEGVVNGLMTVRVGIAAMRVVRPLPFAVQPQPMVKDFIPELVNVAKANATAQ